jgi:hypothetical protein
MTESHRSLLGISMPAVTREKRVRLSLPYVEILEKTGNGVLCNIALYLSSKVKPLSNSSLDLCLSPGNFFFCFICHLLSDSMFMLNLSAYISDSMFMLNLSAYISAAKLS